MRPPHTLLVAAWAFVASSTVLADIAVTGPYVVDFETFSPCDEIGSLLITFDVKLVDEDGRSVYKGNLTYPYTPHDEEIRTDVRSYRWGSTGGWSSFYNVTEYDFVQYLKENFPNIYEVVWSGIGLKDKPVPSGIYHVEHFRPLGLKLKSMDMLPYGRYRFMILQSKDGIELSCIQFIVNVKEDASMASGASMKGMSPYG